MTLSIAELRAAGVILEPDEVVAITQQLIASLRDSNETDEVQAPYGPPSVDNVFLKDDGSVVCRGCLVTPAVSEIGILLESMLTGATARVPSGLRYTIARALLDVDVPPFGSLDELSRDLSRHEGGDRVELVRRVLGRGVPTISIASVSMVDRRQHRATVTDLRRALREADERLFEQRSDLPRDPVIDLLPSPKPVPRDHTRLAALACLAAGLLLVTAGELKHRAQAPSVAAEPVTTTQSAAPTSAPTPGIIAVRDTTASARAPRPEQRRIALKRKSRSKSATGQAGLRAADRDQRRRGVLDRLRLGWLRNAFTAHSDN